MRPVFVALVLLMASIAAGSVASAMDRESPESASPGVDDQSDQRTVPGHVTETAKGLLDEVPYRTQTLSSLIQQQHLNLEAAEDLWAINGQGVGLERASDLLVRASDWQAESLGIEAADPVPLRGHEMPSDALLELAGHFGAESTQADSMEIRQLDRLDEPVRGSLARVVDAFLVLAQTSDSAYADLDLSGYEDFAMMHQMNEHRDVADFFPSIGLSVSGGSMQGQTIEPPGLNTLWDSLDVDLATVLATRAQFMEAVVALDLAVDSVPFTTEGDCDPLQVAPAFTIDLTDCANTYHTDFAFALDVGGDDVYLNNAGGNNLQDGACYWDDAPVYVPNGAAGLIDLGGSDRFGGEGPTGEPRGCGVNGGAHVGGLGILVSAGGDDEYYGEDEGVNGGAYFGGLGLLVDLSGNDTYWGDSFGVNGGANGGLGMLVDLAGNDHYQSGDAGNGGGMVGGVGFLFDATGSDQYVATDGGANGGGLFAGRGFLMDAGGDDGYSAGAAGNGGADTFSAGFLFDLLGDDGYQGRFITSNGAAQDALGILLDGAGTDHYEDSNVPGGSCWDCSVVPKGSAGAQIDGPEGGTDGGPLFGDLPRSSYSTENEICTGSPITIVGDEGPTGFILGHDPITGDPVYRPGSGVTQGRGTQEDPYVIEGQCLRGPAIQVGWDVCVPVIPIVICTEEQVDVTTGVLLVETTAHVVIRDNDIADFDQGVYLDVVENAIVAHNTITRTDEAVRGDGGGGNVVSNNDLTGNVAGVRFLHSPDNRVAGNHIEGHHVLESHFGVHLVESHGASIEDNVIVQNFFGVPIEHSTGVSVTGNEFVRPVRAALLGGGSDHVLEANTIDGNNHTGFLVISSHRNVIRGNIATDLFSFSTLKDSHQNLIHDNHVSRTFVNDLGGGISLFGSDNNRVFDNIAENTYRGIRVGNSHRNVVHNNTLVENNDGILVTSSGENDIRDNTFQGNRADFLFWSAGTNKLWGNVMESGIQLRGSEIGHFVQDWEDPSVEGLPVVYLVDAHDLVIDEPVFQVILVNSSNITVTDGEFEGAAVAVQAALSEGIVITNNEFVDNTMDIRLEHTHGSLITNNTHIGGVEYIPDWHWADLAVLQVALEQSDENTIQNNVFKEGPGSAVLIRDSVLNAVKGNVITGCGEIGVQLYSTESGSDTIVDNQIAGCKRGIELFHSDDNEIGGNALTGNDSCGISLSRSSMNNVHHNDIINSFNGVCSWSGTNNIVDSNDIRENEEGVRVSAYTEGILVQNNNIVGNNGGMNATVASNRVDASWNWWGCAGGPDASSCDSVNGNASYTPWRDEQNHDAGAS